MERAPSPSRETACQVEPAGEAGLVAAARRDPRAFADLYRRYADRLYRYALGCTRSPVLAEDIVSDTMVTALEQLERFDPARGNVGNWLFGIARHRIADEQRLAVRLRRALGRRPPEQPEHAGHAGYSDDVALAVIRDEQAARVDAAIGRLRAADREVLALRYGAELSAAEIGAVLGISDGAARVRLHRALGRLRDEFGSERGDG